MNYLQISCSKNNHRVHILAVSSKKTTISRPYSTVHTAVDSTLRGGGKDGTEKSLKGQDGDKAGEMRGGPFRDSF